MSSYVLPVAGPRKRAMFTPRASVLDQIGRMFVWSRQESEKRRVAAELMALSDRLLLDIGIGRDEIAQVARSGRR